MRLRCDVLSYVNWKDHFVRRMMVRGNRRNEDLEDALMFTRERTKAIFRKLRPGSAAARAHTHKRTLGGDDSAVPPDTGAIRV